MLRVDAHLPATAVTAALDMTSAPEDRFATAAVSEWTTRVIGLTRWAGAGRKLTQVGRLTLTDARELVELLDTGDVIDSKAGGRVPEAVSHGYRIADASDLHRDMWRRCNDRDVHRAVGVLTRFGAVGINGRQDGMSVVMTPLGRRGIRRTLGEPEPGGPVVQPRSAFSDDAG